MKTLTLVAGLALVMAVQPVLAQPQMGILLMRDSDGIVISVIHPIDYYSVIPGVSPGGVVYMMDGHVLEFSSGPGVMVINMAGPTGLGAVAPTAVVGGTTYRVEVSGTDIWLRDPATGIRYATERRVAAVRGGTGLKVNPNGFAME